jgi:hypothetical protein
MESTLLYPADVKVSKLRYSPIKALSSGARIVYINYGDEKLTVQTPLVSLPYGVGDGSFIANRGAGGSGAAAAAEVEPENKRYDLSLSFRGMDDTPKIKSFYDKMVEIEKKIMDDAFDNRLAWLRDDFNGMKPIVTALMNPMIRVDRDKETRKVTNKYPPTMKVKLPYDARIDSFVFDATDMKGEELDFKAVMTKLRGTKAVLVIQLTGLYFSGGKYGCMWKVVTGMFQKVAERKKAVMLHDSDVEEAAKGAAQSDSDLEDEARNVVTGGGKVAAAMAAVTLSDSDDDAPAPAPAAKVVKKPVPAAAPVAPEESDDEDAESEEIEESEDEPTPPPPPPPAAKKKAAAVKKAAK